MKNFLENKTYKLVEDFIGDAEVCQHLLLSLKEKFPAYLSKCDTDQKKRLMKAVSGINSNGFISVKEN